MTPTRLDLSDAAISEFRFLEPKPFWGVRRQLAPPCLAAGEQGQESRESP